MLNKLTNWGLAIFAFLLPFQTRLILRQTVIGNNFIEYGTLTIYGSELLLWMIFLLFILRTKDRQGSPQSYSRFRLSKPDRKLTAICFAFILYTLLSVSWSSHKIEGLGAWLHLIEGVLLFLILFLYRRGRTRGYLTWGFIAGATAQSLIAIYQFLTQSVFASKWLGSALHSAAHLGDSVIETESGRWLRAYGTLPHPNILGGFLVIAILLLLRMAIKNRTDSHGLEVDSHGLNQWKSVVKNPRESAVKRKSADENLGQSIRLYDLAIIAVLALLVTALFFTMSRSAWLAFAVGLLIFLLYGLKVLTQFSGPSSQNKKALINLTPVLVLLPLVLTVLYWPLVKTRFSPAARLEAKSYQQRLASYSEAWQLLKQRPWFGVGIGNYVFAVHQALDPRRPPFAYQPAHNTFMLMLAETGIAGLMIFILLFYYLIKRSPQLILCIPVALIIIGLFDHYLWSLYPGIMIFWLGLGLSLSYNAPKANFCQSTNCE